MLTHEATLFRENEIQLIFTNLVFATAFFSCINPKFTLSMFQSNFAQMKWEMKYCDVYT